MLTPNDYCPECGGIPILTDHVIHMPQFKYHEDSSCSFRWDGEHWKPLPYSVIERERYGMDLASDFDEAFNTLFDELDKMPREHRTKAFTMLSETPWFKAREDAAE